MTVFGGAAAARTPALSEASDDGDDAPSAPAAKRRRTGASGHAADNSGEDAEGQKEAAAGPFGLPLVDDSLPVMNKTNDPFEEAAIIRKACKIKVDGSDVPAPLRSFAELYTK